MEFVSVLMVILIQLLNVYLYYAQSHQITSLLVVRLSKNNCTQPAMDEGNHGGSMACSEITRNQSLYNPSGAGSQ